VILHKFSNCGGSVRLQITNGFSYKGPPHFSRGKIIPCFLSFDENEKQRKNKDGRKKIAS